ncbi:MAG: PQQ-binding-like beta-propeller repeat protein [Pirellulales bacterium]
MSMVDLRSCRPIVDGVLPLAFVVTIAFSAACDAQPPRGRTTPASVSQRNTRDWPQWRGPNRDGLSADTKLLKKWPENGPPVVWKGTGLGEGFSSVSVAGDQIYTMGDLDDACYLFAVSRDGGEVIWKAKIGRAGEGGGYRGPRSTPTVNEDRVYALSHFGDLVCANAKSGEIIWRKNLEKDFQGRSGGWKYAESPLVDGEKLVCTPGGREATMVALDKRSGKVIWKGRTEEGERAGYASAVVAEIGGLRQYVQLLSQGGASFAADDGRLLWRYGNRFEDNTANIPTPIVQGDRVFFAAGYGRGGGMVRVTKEGSKFNVEELWFERDLNNKHGGVIWVGDYLYGDRDDNGIPWCADARTGDIAWESRSQAGGSGSAAVTYADGHLYWRFQNGVVALVLPTPDGYREVSSFTIPTSGEPGWPHPVVVDGRLYLRDQETLWCYDVRAKEEGRRAK